MPKLDVRLIFFIYQSVLTHNIPGLRAQMPSGGYELVTYTNRFLKLADSVHSFFSVLITRLFEKIHVYSRKMRRESKKSL